MSTIWDIFWGCHGIMSYNVNHGLFSWGVYTPDTHDLFFWSRVDVTRLISISCWSAHCITLFYTFPVWYLFCLRQLLTSLQPFCWTLRKDTKTQHSTTKVAFGIHNDGKVIDVYNDQPHPPCRKGLLGAARGWSETVVSYFWRLTVQRFVGIHNNMYYSMYIYIFTLI